MRFLSSLPHKRIAWTVFYVLLAVFIGYFLFRYLLAVFLPFLLAFITALSLRRPSRALAGKKTRWIRPLRVALVILLLSAILLLITVILTALIRQLGDFLSSFAEEENAILSDLSRMLDRFSLFLSGLPFFHGEDTASMRETLIAMFSEFLKNSVMNLATRLPEWVASLISAVPKILFFFAVTVISAIYFCLDIEKILNFFKTHLDEKAKKAVHIIGGECAGAALNYFRSYIILFLFTFSELFFGFALLQKKYAFLLALITALIDILPVLGTGTVLIPWALWLFLTGHFAHAVGLIVLYVIIIISRQVVEPRIMGAGMGMPPLVMLISMYAGLKLFGFWGMILMPPLVIVIKNSILALNRLEKEAKA